MSKGHEHAFINCSIMKKIGKTKTKKFSNRTNEKFEHQRNSEEGVRDLGENRNNMKIIYIPQINIKGIKATAHEWNLKLTIY
jgi:hypothetical protein